MATGNESPMSVTIQTYYKGFSVLITKRDETAEVKPLIKQSMEAIDHMVKLGFKPSWNEETNKQALSVTEGDWENINTEEEEYTREPVEDKPDYCKQHKEMMNKREGQFGTFYSHYHAAFGYCNGKGYKKKS